MNFEFKSLLLIYWEYNPNIYIEIFLQYIMEQ